MTIRRSLHLLAAWLLLTLYGAQVCPFLESLTLMELALPLGAALLLSWPLSALTQKGLIQEGPWQTRPGRRFWLEFLLLAALGFALALLNMMLYGFPLGSGLKLLTGILLLGFFASLDLALLQGRRTLLEAETRELKDRPNSLPARLFVVAASLVVLVSLVFFLVIAKDLDWLAQVGESIPQAVAQRAVLGEFAFIAAILLAYLLNLGLSFTTNLKLQLKGQHETLERARLGDLSARTPVASNDELGLIAQHTNRMIQAQERAKEELLTTQEVTILSLASLAETRDNETGKHILRTQHFVRILAEHLAKKERYQEELSERNIELITQSAPLHDVGKIGIPDAILLKPGKLTYEEFEIMKGHAEIGAKALENGALPLGENSFLRFAKEIALSHHEKWDGSGYPKGLKGEEIPLPGRLMAVADVYDALRMKRVYKEGMSHEKAKEILLEGSGQHFDPTLIEAFLALEGEFIAIEQRFRD